MRQKWSSEEGGEEGFSGIRVEGIRVMKDSGELSRRVDGVGLLVTDPTSANSTPLQPSTLHCYDCWTQNVISKLFGISDCPN